MNDKIAGKSAVFTVHDEVSSAGLASLEKHQQMLMKHWHTKTLANQPPWNMQTIPKYTLHGIGTTLEEAVANRTDGWKLPSPADLVHHDDGAVPLRVSRNFEGKDHLLSVGFYRWATAWQSTERVRTPAWMLSWREPIATPKWVVADMLVAVCDMVALHNGAECVVVGTSRKVLNSLRHGEPRGRR